MALLQVQFEPQLATLPTDLNQSDWLTAQDVVLILQSKTARLCSCPHRHHAQDGLYVFTKVRGMCGNGKETKTWWHARRQI